ncbi:helix-turn-helix domain-containing protein [Frankia gtarii]|uniref:helix-turn-helix domain-containing protein n=1 Tax=Frankia gtarii TaxID=2950102 RepID=UPI0021C14259|nr:helix-turn-helix domain-containing protein [Frankia gtarii]
MSIVRYRYRAYPRPGQVRTLARAFGCARVVFNDAIRTREEAYAAGEKLSDIEVQRRVATRAKRTEERTWLTEVSSVVLVQACRDAVQAFKNWFASLSGKGKGPKIGYPNSDHQHGRDGALVGPRRSSFRGPVDPGRHPAGPAGRRRCDARGRRGDHCGAAARPALGTGPVAGARRRHPGPAVPRSRPGLTGPAGQYPDRMRPWFVDLCGVRQKRRHPNVA